jgi:hypothetical protein
MKKILEQNEKALLAKKNVVGVGIGEKWSNGKNTGKPAMLVFVSHKESTDKLSKKDLIPQKIGDVPTDVVGKSGVFRAEAYTARVRPLKPGYSCGHLHVTAGTIGAFFMDKDGQVVGLSNNHVVAATNRGIRNRHLTVQPGRYDARRWRGNRVGQLKHFVKMVGPRGYAWDPVKKQRVKGYNFEDSGTFKLYKPEDIDLNIPQIGPIAGWNDNVKVGEMLQKSGRTTEYTKNKVVALGATVTVWYDHNQKFQFRDQIVTADMSRGGDSGSLVLDMNGNVAALLFAGSNTATIMNPIKYPRASYGLQLMDTVSLTESLVYILTVDGQKQPTTYGEKDYAKAVANARSLARGGATVNLVATFNATPE